MDYTFILTSIRQIIRSTNLESKRLEKELGISTPQLLCLTYLENQPDFKATHKAIKDHLQLNASTVTGIISRLEKKGLVARLPRREGDKRVGYITITAKGVDLLREAPEPLHHQLVRKLKKLSPEELVKLQSSFETIIEFLQIDKVEASPIITSGVDIQE
jgi:DNA-binding MarR family transcriptional regulator